MSPVPSSAKPSRKSLGPPKRRISGSLTLTPEILAMKKEQEEAKQKAERILAYVTTPTPPDPTIKR